MTFDPTQLGLDSTPDLRLTLCSPTATRALGRALGQRLGGGDFLGLIGELGAGKTTLVKGLLDALCPGALATSPTYTLINLHPTPSLTLAHMDLYRLERPDDLEGIGYWEYLDSPDHLLCVEWLNTLPQAWPGAGVLVTLEHDSPRRVASIWCEASRRGEAAALSDAFKAILEAEREAGREAGREAEREAEREAALKSDDVSRASRLPTEDA